MLAERLKPPKEGHWPLHDIRRSILSNSPHDQLESANSFQGSHMEKHDDSHPLKWALVGPPLGHWGTEQGSFNAVMWDKFSFFTDGTGLFKSFSGSGNHTQKFLWQHLKPGILSVFHFCVESDDPNYFEDQSNNPDLPENWNTLNYYLDWTTIDAGGARIPTLKQCRKNKNGDVNIIFESFWLSVHSHVSFLGPLENNQKT